MTKRRIDPPGCHSGTIRALPLGALALCLAALGGMAPEACAQQWLIDANQRIDLFRKANLTVEVVDSMGQAVEGADIHVEMKRHSFGFGTAVPAGWINNPSADGVMFREKLLENFNQVVFENDLKWPAWDGLWGSSFNWPNSEQALDWLDANNLPARGHYLSWATWSGNDAWGSSQNTSTLPTRLYNHITDKATTVGDRVFEWDVINHPVGWLNDTYENRIPSGLEFYADIIDHSRSVAPEGMPMWINEDDIIAGGFRANDYERIIEYLIANDSPPDGIGFQGHFIQEWGRVTSSSPEEVYDRIERFAAFELPLRTTEFDIDVGNDEAWQGELMHDYLTVMFSHPDMEAITLWGFWGGSHWRGENGALYRTNWTEKPSLLAYRDLVFDQWWTDESGTSDEAGEHQLRAFKGQYDITVTFNGQDYVLTGASLDGDMSALVTLPFAIGVPGDYNDDGRVDAGDYVRWRNHLGDADESALNNNGDGGAVTLSDYTWWKQHYGDPPGSGSGATGSASAAVPEPAAAALALVGLVGLACRRSRAPEPDALRMN